MTKSNKDASWVDFLTRNINGTRLLGISLDGEREAEQVWRNRLVAKMRWLLLLVTSLYGLFAASTFSLSRYGFFLSRQQVLFLLLSIFVVACYNSVYHFLYDRFQHVRYIDHLEIVLDFLFVTVLIHFSGGAASWFWPVYLIVTIEAAFLLERYRDVWLTGAMGGMLYGLLLVLENRSLVGYVPMPFVNTQLHEDTLYVVLIVCWVGLLNVAAAIIATFLMSEIRVETSLARESEQKLLNFLDTANDLIHCVSLEGQLLYANRAMLQALQYRKEELVRKDCRVFLGDESRNLYERGLARVSSGETLTTLEAVFRAQDGQDISVEGSLTCSFRDGQPTAIWGIWRDVTERKLTQARLYNLAHHDNLTGLPNRILFLDRLKQAMSLAHRHHNLTALLFLDLDRFKVINDTLGHPTGDKLLLQVAKRLSGSLREIDSVARFGGDEYTVILCNLERREDAELVAHKILNVIARPYNIDDHELFVTASIGISIYPLDSEDLDSLIKKADVAMYHAKGLGGGMLQYYDSFMDEDSHRRLVLENSLRKALEKNEFRLYYQPKVNIVSGQITALEALLRWEHPELGILLPGEFIPLAEETGLIIPIGEWVMEEACRQHLAWEEQGLPRLRVAVNLSGHQLQQKNFLDVVTAVLQRTGLDPEFLEFEITETVIMQNPDAIIQMLTCLRDMGMHISVDDFGTGYSSLAQLKRFSVNTLKIDKSFVRDVVQNKTDAAIATAIIAMGNSLNLKVIAEGVETAGQYAFLKDTMCDEIQGYLVSRPIPPDKVVEFISQKSWELRVTDGETVQEPALTQGGIIPDDPVVIEAEGGRQPL